MRISPCWAMAAGAAAAMVAMAESARAECRKGRRCMVCLLGLAAGLAPAAFVGRDHACFVPGRPRQAQAGPGGPRRRNDGRNGGGGERTGSEERERGGEGKRGELGGGRI